MTFLIPLHNSLGFVRQYLRRSLEQENHKEKSTHRISGPFFSTPLVQCTLFLIPYKGMTSPPSHLRMWRTYALRQCELFSSERTLCMHCHMSVKGKGVVHTHCYFCDTSLLPTPYNGDMGWVRRKLFVEGSDNIYNYRISCYNCSLAEMMQYPSQSLAQKENIRGKDSSIDIYYTNYVQDKNPSPREEGSVQRVKSCDIL